MGSISLQSLADPNYVKDVNVLVVNSLPVDSTQIARPVDVDKHDQLKGVKLIELPTDEVDV